MFETLSGGRRRRKPNMSWIDNVTSWTGLSLAQAYKRQGTDQSRDGRSIMRSTLDTEKTDDQAIQIAPIQT